LLQTLVESAISGVITGGMYGAIAVGLSLIFGVLRVINFAHGSFLMIAMFAYFWLWYLFGLEPYLAAVVVVPAIFLLGYAVQNLVITPMYKRERALVVEPIGVLLLTAGLALVMDNLALMFFQSDFRVIGSRLGEVNVPLGFMSLSLTRVIACLAGLAMAVGIGWFLARTELGKAIRAVSQNREAAALCGVNVYRTYNLTFGLGSALVALAGALIAPFFYVYPGLGAVFGVRSFLVVVLGGLGSIPGAVLGGIVIGVVEAVTALFVPATSAIIFAFALFVLVLLFRPTGLMGTLEG
jgi:branched-chain amino acid transport system permease protein